VIEILRAVTTPPHNNEVLKITLLGMTIFGLGSQLWIGWLDFRVFRYTPVFDHVRWGWAGRAVSRVGVAGVMYVLGKLVLVAPLIPFSGDTFWIAIFLITVNMGTLITVAHLHPREQWALTTRRMERRERKHGDG
jgi:hypothetical protein